MRWLGTIVVCLLAILAAQLPRHQPAAAGPIAVTMSAPATASLEPVSYEEAAAEFNDLELAIRRDIQVLLATAGFTGFTISQRYSPELYAALRQFQRAHGYTTTGVILVSQFRKLCALSEPVIARALGTEASGWQPASFAAVQSTSGVAATTVAGIQLPVACIRMSQLAQ